MRTGSVRLQNVGKKVPTHMELEQHVDILSTEYPSWVLFVLLEVNAFRKIQTVAAPGSLRATGQLFGGYVLAGSLCG